MSIIFNNFVNLWLSSVTGTSDNCLRCYYCPLESSSVNVIIKHYATSHGESQFSIRHKILHEETGIFNYKSAHFPMRAREGGRRSPAVACWASDHRVASSNPLRGMFRH